MIDLNKIIASQTGPLNLPVGSYYLQDTALLKYSLSGLGSTFSLAPDKTNFKAINEMVVISNINTPTAGLFFEAAAPHCSVAKCNIGTSNQAVKTLPGGTYVTVINNTFGITNTVSVYIDQDGAYISGNKMAGSKHEYTLRLDMGGPDGKTIPSIATISGNNINQIITKDTIGIRCYHDVTIQNNTVLGDIRWGQVNEATNQTGQYATGMMINNTFINHNQPTSLVQCYQGVNLMLDSNKFLHPNLPVVAADTFSVVYSKNNTAQYYFTQKQYPFFAASSKGTYVDEGGNKNIIV